MKEWEYDIMRLKGKWDDIEDSLCIKGSQGWELVTIFTKLPTSRTSELYIAVFKRPVAE